MKRISSFRLNNECGAVGLIALLVCVAIGLVIVVVMMGPTRTNKSGKAQTTYGQAKEKATDVECQSNLRQIRAAIEIYRTEHEAPPPSTADIKIGVSDPKFLSCPVGGEAFVYNPQAGTITCPHPGHERF